MVLSVESRRKIRRILQQHTLSASAIRHSTKLPAYRTAPYTLSAHAGPHSILPPASAYAVPHSTTHLHPPPFDTAPHALSICCQAEASAASRPERAEEAEGAELGKVWVGQGNERGSDDLYQSSLSSAHRTALLKEAKRR
eukprot:1190011-Rhodomonas_salina.2